MDDDRGRASPSSPWAWRCSFGFELRLALPHLERGGRERTLPSMFVFGVSYAVASLSCTLPVFLSVVAGTFSRSNAASGIAMYVCFALGMGLVLTVLTLALALARQSLVHRLRSALPLINRIAGVLLVVAGAYFTWYGIYELRIRDDPRTAAGPVDTVTGWSSDITTWIQDLGAERLGPGARASWSAPPCSTSCCRPAGP